jgi:transcriptional regulator with XRE-family HTH domain
MAPVEIVPALASAIEARRDQLGLSPTELAERAGVTLPGLAPLRRGERRAYQDRLTVGVEDALSWPRGTIRSILAGRPAPDLQAPIHTDVTAAVLARLERIEAHLGLPPIEGDGTRSAGSNVRPITDARPKRVPAAQEAAHPASEVPDPPSNSPTSGPRGAKAEQGEHIDG